MAAISRVIRVFISSPGDVAEERDKARRVLADLQRLYVGVTLEPLLWEDLALPATASFQESIDALLNQQPIDIAVFILWSRLGSPLGAAITRPDGTPYRSGTEREFDLMLAAFQQSGKKRPVILATTGATMTAASAETLADCPGDRLEEIIAQQKLADSFIREQFYDAEGHNVRALHSYHEPVSFAQQLRAHLRHRSPMISPQWEPARRSSAGPASHIAAWRCSTWPTLRSSRAVTKKPAICFSGCATNSRRARPSS